MLVVDRVPQQIGFSKELFTEVSNNIKVITDEEWAQNSDNYKRVWFAVYVRTDRDNLVLMIDKDRISNISDPPSFMNSAGLYPTYLFDSGLMCGKQLIESAFSFKSTEALKRLVGGSACFPLGAYATKISNVLVFNVIVSSSVLSDEEISLKDGFHFVPIQSLKVRGKDQQTIADTLVLVKDGGENNE